MFSPPEPRESEPTGPGPLSRPPVAPAAPAPCPPLPPTRRRAPSGGRSAPTPVLSVRAAPAGGASRPAPALRPAGAPGLVRSEWPAPAGATSRTPTDRSARGAGAPRPARTAPTGATSRIDAIPAPFAPSRWTASAGCFPNGDGTGRPRRPASTAPREPLCQGHSPDGERGRPQRPALSAPREPLPQEAPRETGGAPARASRRAVRSEGSAPAGVTSRGRPRRPAAALPRSASGGPAPAGVTSRTMTVPFVRGGGCFRSGRAAPVGPLRQGRFPNGPRSPSGPGAAHRSGRPVPSGASPEGETQAPSARVGPFRTEGTPESPNPRIPESPNPRIAAAPADPGAGGLRSERAVPAGVSRRTGGAGRRRRTDSR